MSKSHSTLQMPQQLAGTEHLSARLFGKRFPSHFHDTFVIELVKSGEDWCSTSGIVARSDEVFVHFPFATHDGGTLEGGHLNYEAIYPTLDFFKSVTGVEESKIPIGQSLVSSASSIVKPVKHLFTLLNSIGREAKWDSAVEEVFFNVLAIGDEQKLQEENQGLDQKLNSARDYMLENATEDVSVEELSQYCGLSKFHLIRAFKKRFGITPRKFLISQRVTLAKRLLASGVPIIQAAYATGFNDQSHLSRCFKKLTSCSPGQFCTAMRNAVA